MPQQHSALSINTVVAFEFGLGLVALLLGWFLDFDPLRTVQRGPQVFAANLGLMALGTALALPLLAFFLSLDRLNRNWLESIREVLQQHLVPLMEEIGWSGRAVVSLAAGVGEEILFRGFIQDGAQQYFGIVGGLVLASVLFGFAHWVNWTYFLLATLIGGVLGLIFLWTGSLVTPITTHAVYDFLALEQLVRQSRQTAATK